MPHLSESNRNDIERLKESYHSLPWYAKWFFPSKITAALSLYQSSSPNETMQALHICRVFLKDSGSIQRWFFSFFDSCLEVFSVSDLICSVNTLSTSNLLTEDEEGFANFNAVVGHKYPQFVVCALLHLDRNLLIGDGAQANRDVLAGHQDPYLAAEVLQRLHLADLLTGDSAQANRNVVAGHQELAELLNAFQYENGLLTRDGAQANFNAIAGHKDPRAVARALSRLSSMGFLTGDAAQANRDTVAKNQDPEEVARAFNELRFGGILTGDGAQAIRDVLAGHQDPHLAARVLVILHFADLLTGDRAQANRNVVAGHQDLELILQILVLFSHTNLLTKDAGQANFDVIIGQQDLETVFYDIAMLDKSGLLTKDAAQANFDAKVGCQDPRVNVQQSEPAMSQRFFSPSTDDVVGQSVTNLNSPYQ